MRNIIVVMYQTSNSKGQELVAQRMVKWFTRFGYRSWLVTSVFHDDEPIVDLNHCNCNYVVFNRDPKVGVPSVRVRSIRVLWPPRRVMFVDFIEILNELDRELGIDAVVTHSTLWNGPEDVAKWITWRRTYRLLGGDVDVPIYAHMSHYQPPDPIRYNSYERSYRLAWNSLIFPIIFQSCDLILCLTPLEVRDMLTLGAPPDKIHVFPYGLDDDEAKLIDEAKPDLVLEKYGLPRDKKIVTYLGTIEFRKNPLAVVRVAAKLVGRDDVFFVIAGRSGDQYREVVELARKLPNIKVLGELSVEEKTSLIKASYINITLSRMEALGLTQLEFMYGGVPVITSGVYGQKWVVRDGVDGLHVKGPDDIDGAVEAVKRLLDDESLYAFMSRNARERAKRFLMSALMSRLINRLRKFEGEVQAIKLEGLHQKASGRSYYR
jgi:glycosyltransferase involved in cell wall biosynthesis